MSDMNEIEEVVSSDSVVEPDLPWITLVWNDPVNLMSYVTWVFQSYFGYDRAKAEKLMMDVHTKGRAVVSHGPREKMEIDTEAFPADTIGPFYHDGEVISKPLDLGPPHAKVPDGPGLGITLSQERLKRCHERYLREGAYDYFRDPHNPSQYRRLPLN